MKPGHRPLKSPDIRYSSAASNPFGREILKTYYLNHFKVENTQDLLMTTAKAIEDFNNLRPHGQLNGLTPYEAYTGKVVDKALLTIQMLEARRNRTQINRTSPCPGCTF